MTAAWAKDLLLRVDWPCSLGVVRHAEAFLIRLTYWSWLYPVGSTDASGSVTNRTVQHA